MHPRNNPGGSQDIAARDTVTSGLALTDLIGLAPAGATNKKKFAALSTVLALFKGVIGVAGGYKIARGVHTQVAASDTIATGLTTVVAVIAVPQTRTLKQLYFDCSIGNQSGAPAAGSILILSKKPTAANDCTPVAATDFTDNIPVNWIAIGV